MRSEDKRNKAREKWEKNKRIWYNVYLFLGIGINFIIYFIKPYGFDPGKSIFLGSVAGLGIPLIVMFICAYIHERIIGLK